MEISGRKSELIKPILLKAGIPLVVSFAGFIYSFITVRRKLRITTPLEEEQPNLHEEESQDEFVDEEDQTTSSLISFGIQYRPSLEEVILGLTNQLRDVEARFICYSGLKEYELAFMKLQHELVLEQVHVEFMDLRSKNRLLGKKARKLWRTRGKYAKIMHTQASMLQARDDEISVNREQLQGKTQVILELESEIATLKRLVDLLQEEKKEFADQNSRFLQKESQDNTHLELLTELEQLKKDRAAEVEELIYLRWINACFKHEITRNQEQEDHEPREKKHETLEQILKYDSDASSSTITDHDDGLVLTSRKKPTILNKMRKWVKGSEACRKSWSGKEEEDDRFERIRYVKGRKSCSSV